jgi:hypothetical protein
VTERSKAERGPKFLVRPDEPTRILLQEERAAYVEELDEILQSLWPDILEEIATVSLSEDVALEEGVMVLLRTPDSAVAMRFMPEEQLWDHFGAATDAVRYLLGQCSPHCLRLVYVDGHGELHVAVRSLR